MCSLCFCPEHLVETEQYLYGSQQKLKNQCLGLYTCSCEVSSKVNVRLCQILILTHQVFLWCEQITILVVSLVHFVVTVPVVHIC